MYHYNEVIISVRVFFKPQNNLWEVGVELHNPVKVLLIILIDSAPVVSTYLSSSGWNILIWIFTAHITPCRLMKGLMACGIHCAMAWNVSSASEDLRCKFGLSLVITRPWNSPVIGFLPASHPFYQCGHHFRWLRGQHGGCEERKFGSSNVAWIIGRVLGMWSYTLLNFAKKINELPMRLNHSLDWLHLPECTSGSGT